MYKYITLDIETIPTQRTDVRGYFAKTVGKDTAEKLANIKAPANYKDVEKIEDYIEAAKSALLTGEESAINEAVNKTSFDGAFGQVVCIGYQLDEYSEPETIHGLDEPDVLGRFNDMLNEKIKPSDVLSASIVGHNVTNFDLRFLMQRYIVNGIRPHALIVRAAQAKPWESEKVFDTMTQFAGVGNRISLDKLCMALGIEGKGDITGADVWPMVQADKQDEVAMYCKHDVQITRNVFKRMTFA